MDETVPEGKIMQAAFPGFELFPFERRERILETLKNQGKVLAADLADSMKVSIDTIRRDLKQLATEGLVRRVHGGALAAAPFPRPVVERAAQESTVKRDLGQRAAAMIQPNNLVLFDGGSTNEELVRWIPPDVRFTALTPSLPVASALCKLPAVEVIVLGGRVLKRELVATGARAVRDIGDFRADLCYLGVCALHQEVGVSTFSVEELELKQALVRCSGSVVAIVTSEKFGKMAPFIIGPLGILNHVFVETDVSQADREQLRSQGVSVD
ncbi:MAG: DeoR/GlpR transcriptional regulator [Verrucomicrobia bacterium]|nr:DeoR/GlpR transcriptional regulator [Verrucomicrobiota bacterium]